MRKSSCFLIVALAGACSTEATVDVSGGSESAAVQTTGEVKPAAEPGHELGSVTGTNIDMKVYDHAMAGALNGGVAFIVYEESEGGSRLTLRKYGETIQAEFKEQADNTLGGVITSGQNEQARTTKVEFVGLDSASNTFKLQIGDEEVTVAITTEGTVGGHMKNPTFSTTIAGQPVSFRVEVECCYGYAIFASMAILGGYAH
jgi:hypothetical protein